MGLPSWVYGSDAESEWEDKGIFLRNRRTGEVRPKGIAGGLPGLGKVEAPGPVESYLDTVKETYRGVPARIKEGLAGIPELPAHAVNFLIPSSPQGRLQADPSDVYGNDGFVRDTRESVRAGYGEAQEKLSEAARGLPPVLAASAESASELAAAIGDPTNLAGAGVGAKLAREGGELAVRAAARGIAEETPKKISSLAARVLPGEDISERFASFLRGKGVEDPDLYYDLSDAARKALDKEFLAVDAGPQGSSWGRFLDQQGLRPDDYAALPGVERARLEGEFRQLLPKTRQAAPGATISSSPEALPVSALDRATESVAAPSGLPLRAVGDLNPDEALHRLAKDVPSGLIGPEDLPFELRDLPLTRWHLPKQRAEAIPGVEFYTVGDTTHYTRSAGAGGNLLKMETFTPRNPLVVNGGASGAAKAMGLAEKTADFDQAERALFDYATARGHDSVVTFHPGDKDLQVIKLPGAEPGMPRRSPYLEAYADAMGPGWRKYLTPEEAAKAEEHGRQSISKPKFFGSGSYAAGGPQEIASAGRRLVEWKLTQGVLAEHGIEFPERFASFAERKAFVAEALAKIPDDGTPASIIARGRLREKLGIDGIVPADPAPRVSRPKINPEAGFIRLGPGGAETPPDPVLAGFHSEVFGREATATVGEKLEALGGRLQKEMVEAYTPLLKMAKRFGPVAEDEIEVAIQRTRSASHTQMNPVLRFTEEYDPLANGGRGDWIKTGKPLTEEVTAKLSGSERIEFESILAAGSQLEFAGRKVAADAQAAAFQASRTAERNMLRLLGQEQRRELRGLSHEARALRAEELRAARTEARATGQLDVLERLRRQALREGVEVPGGGMARREARAWASGVEGEGAAAAARDTESALRRGIGDLSRDELRRYRERLAVARPPDLPDMRLDIDPVRTAQARDVMRHAEGSGLLKKYDELLGSASVDRSTPGTGYRGWADRAWLRPAVGAGFITEGDRVAILGKNQMYSLFQQVDTLARAKGVDMAAGEVPNAPRFLKNAPPSVIHGVRKSPLETRMAGLQEGRQIAPVLEASAIQAARFQRLVDRQLVKNKLADLVEQTPDLAPEIVKTADPMAPGSFVAFRGGEKVYLQAPPDLLENLDRLTAQQSAFILETAQRATGVLRVAATTYSPGFPALSNLPRDIQRSWITSQHGMLPGEPLYTLGKEIVHRLFNKFEPSAMWREFDEGVAAYSSFVKADSEGINRAMQEAAQATTGSPSARRIVELVNPITYLREMAQFKEAATRVTEKSLARRGGRSWFRGQANPAHVDPATGEVLARTRTESDLDAAKVSLNFMTGGSFTRETNRYLGFSNAQALDGADFFRQVTGPRRLTVIAKATAGITLPALYEVWHYRNDPEYRNLPWWDRSMFWHLGKMGDDIPQGSEVMADGYIRTPTGEIRPPRTFWDGSWRRVLRPPGLFNLVFGILPSLAFEASLDSNPKAAEEAVAGLVEQTPMQYFLDYDEPSGDINANLFPLVPDALRPPLEAGVNRKGFPFGQAVDPRGTEEADPALRWNEQTPLWARSLSERSAPGAYHGSVSPNRLQRVVEGYTAGAGKAAGGLVDRALAGRQDPNEDPYADTQDPLTPRDVPFLRAIMGAPAQGPGSAPVKEFWARYDTARQSSDVLKGWEAAGRVDQARKALEAHPELRYKSDLESTAGRLREMGKQRNEILAAPFHVLGPEQKRAYRELVDQGMTQAAGQLLLYIQQQELARQQGSP